MKPLRDVITKARREGWRVEEGKICRFLSPDGKSLVTCHFTESDHRALKNTVARLRRGGLKI